MPKIGYVVPTWNGARLVETLHSIPAGARCLVIDNSIQNWPLSKAWNYGIDRLCRKEHCDAVIVMNDDIVLAPDTGEKLAWALLQGQYGRVKPELLLVSGYNIAMERPGALPHNLPEFSCRWKTGPDFSCFATNARLLDVVGPFDEGFQAYCEDNDMHLRIRLAGYEGASYAPYYHYASTTVKTDPSRRGIVGTSKQRYLQKWGGEPGHERYATPWNGRAQ